MEFSSLDIVSQGFRRAGYNLYDFPVDVWGDLLCGEHKIGLDPLGQLVHNGQDARFPFPVYRFRTQNLSRIRLLKNDIDAEVVAGSRQVSLDDVIDSAPRSHSLQLFPGIAPCLQEIHLPEDIVEIVSAQDMQVPGLGKVNNQKVGESTPPMVEFFLSGVVLEIHDRNGWFIWRNRQSFLRRKKFQDDDSCDHDSESNNGRDEPFSQIKCDRDLPGSAWPFFGGDPLCSGHTRFDPVQLRPHFSCALVSLLFILFHTS